MDWGTNSLFWAVFFWINVVVCAALVVVVVQAVRKYEAKRKQLKADLEGPELKDVKWLFKHKLKEHGIGEPPIDSTRESDN